MKKSDRIDFFIVKKCLNNCIFCSERFKLDNSELSLSEIKEILSYERERGARLVHFVGGEPTLHSKFPEILKIAKQLNYNVFIITNAIKFSSESFCKKTLPYLDEIMVSVHGHDKKTHGENTRNPDAFDLLSKGLDNLKKYFKGRLEATSAITVNNFRHLHEIARLIDGIGIKEYQCMSVVPEGEGSKNFLRISPSYAELSKELERVIKYCEKKGIKIRFSGIPMCILSDKYMYSHDLWEPFKVDNTEFDRQKKKEKIILWKEPGNVTRDFKIDIGRIKTKKCKNCAKKMICGGIYQKYYEEYGDEELIPFKE